VAGPRAGTTQPQCHERPQRAVVAVGAFWSLVEVHLLGTFRARAAGGGGIAHGPRRRGRLGPRRFPSQPRTPPSPPPPPPPPPPRPRRKQQGRGGRRTGAAARFVCVYMCVCVVYVKNCRPPPDAPNPLLNAPPSSALAPSLAACARGAERRGPRPRAAQQGTGDAPFPTSRPGKGICTAYMESTVPGRDALS